MTTKELSDLIETEGTAIYSFCYYLTQNKVEADDLYQETFLKALEKCENISLSGNPKSFLLSIAVNLWKNQSRKYARHQRIAGEESLEAMEEWLLPAEEELTPEEQVVNREIHDLIRRETNLLEDKLRIPVYLYYTGELPVESIAKMLCIPKGTVKSRLHKARNIIKQRLEEKGYVG